MSISGAIKPRQKLRINLSKIASVCTKDYLSKNGLIDEDDLSKVMPVCYLEGVTDDFHRHVKTYTTKHPVDKVWKAYLNIPPVASWAGKRIKFSFSYNKETKRFHYLNDEYAGLKVNQLIFIEIKLLFGLIKLAVTHHVNQILPDKKKIKLCYVQGGKSAGSQIISFEKITDSETRIVHETFYKSDSEFRDKKLYPMLHEKIINQFHQNVFKYLEA
ncbi:MAG: hypothetical protein NXI00_15830 [Cytophagales bacterium]|nr:hypothetical protein [Cytophagales bacterium]